MWNDFEPDHQHVRNVVNYYADAVNRLVDAGRMEELRKALEVREALVGLLELLDYVEEAIE